MSRTSNNSLRARPKRSTAFGFVRLALVGTIGLCLAIPSSARSQSEPTLSIAQPRTSPLDRLVQDLRLAIRVRTALAKDDKLGPLNLGVRMNEGTATVWGAVPDRGYYDDIRRRLLDVPGVFAVRTDMYVERFELEDGDEPAPAIGGPKPTIVQSAIPDRKRGVLSHVTLPETRSPTTDEPPLAGDPVVGLMAPVMLSSRTVAPPTPGREHVMATSQAIEDIRRGDSRFHNLRWEMHDERIVLMGVAHQGASLMAFAQKVREVPGVKRVAIKQTRR